MTASEPVQREPGAGRNCSRCMENSADAVRIERFRGRLLQCFMGTRLLTTIALNWLSPILTQALCGNRIQKAPHDAHRLAALLANLNESRSRPPVTILRCGKVSTIARKLVQASQLPAIVSFAHQLHRSEAATPVAVSQPHQRRALNSGRPGFRAMSNGIGEISEN